MGYVIRITRQNDESLDDDCGVDDDEWAEIVDDDDALEWDEVNGPEAVMWSGPPETPLWYRDGEISTKNPSTEAVKKMYEIAFKLNAVVEGDDGELYNANGEAQRTPESDRTPLAGDPEIPFWKRLFGLK